MNQTNDPDDRLPFVKAYARVSYVISIALEMVVPGVLGYWIDYHLGTKLLFAVLGFAFGMSYGVWQLVRLGQNETDHGLLDGNQQTTDQETEQVSARTGKSSGDSNVAD